MKKDTLKKSISALLTVVMMGAGFAGCGKENSEETKSLLEGTILENGFVIYVDEEPILMTYVADKFGCPNYHYMDVTTGNYYHVPNTTMVKSEYCSASQTDGVMVLPKETEVKVITNELTEEELLKAIEGKFTDADVIKVQQRLAKEVK